MSPRPYRMDRRREAANETHSRIINAARELLATLDGSTKFSVEEVARRAEVARMTVYHQFGSFQGLIQGLCDSLASAGGMHHLAEAFRLRDPLQALDEFVAVFMRFWSSDRLVRRGLGAMAVLDPDIAAVLEERSGWRRKGLKVLLGRLSNETGRPKAGEMDTAVDLIYMLTDFNTYDSLAGPKRSLEQVTKMVQQLARQVLS